MQSIALVIHVILAVVVIGLVLMQHGKGADAGAAFGSGASATVFGARGATSFLTRMTTATAFLFFLTSVLLFWIAAHRDDGVRSVTDSVTDVPGLVDEVPAAPAIDLPGGVEAEVPSAPDAPELAPEATPGTDVAPADAELPAPVEPPAGQALPEPVAPAPAAPSDEAAGTGVETPATVPATD